MINDNVILLSDIKNMDSFIDGIDFSISEKEFKKHGSIFLYKDNDDFTLGYNYMRNILKKENEKKQEDLIRKRKYVRSYKAKHCK